MVEPVPQPALDCGSDCIGGGSSSLPLGQRRPIGIQPSSLGVGLGIGLALGFLLSHRKQYARIDAGEFIRATMSRRLRITRDLSLPVAIILFAGVMAYCILEGRLDQIFALMLALGIAFWAQYGFTLLWERRHQKTLISEKGSMYTLDMAAGDGCAC